MYVPREQWSVPELRDPPPCFRQGDLVRLTWVRPEVSSSTHGTGTAVRITNIEVRTEVVALLSACCDLVIHAQPKRKGITVSPLREVPRNIASNEVLLAGLKANHAKAVSDQQRVPRNLFYYAPIHPDIKEGVVYLEAIAMVDFSVLKSAEKVAELSNDDRAALQERIKFHFTR